MPDSMLDNLPTGKVGAGEMKKDSPPFDGGRPPMPGDDDKRQIPKERIDPGMREGEPTPMRGGMQTYNNDQAMLEDPTSILKRIQEEMGLV